MDLSIEIAGYIQSNNQERLEKAIKNNPELAEGITPQGITLLILAAYCRNEEAVKLILARKSRINLYEAVVVGNLDMVRQHLVIEPYRINSFSVDGFTPLGLASYFGHEEIVEFMIKMGAEINQPSNNNFGICPIHCACSIGNKHIVKLLLDNGADVNLPQKSGGTALHAAAREGDLELVKMLVKAGADAEASMLNKQTPMQIAKEKGFSDVIGYFRLLKHAKEEQPTICK